MTNEEQKQIFEALNDFYCEVHDIDPNKTDLTFNEDSGIIEGYAFMFQFEDDDMPNNISFNDSIPTSAILNLADTIIPYLEDALEEPVMISECFVPVINKKGDCTGLMFESDYEKVCKKTKVPKE